MQEETIGTGAAKKSSTELIEGAVKQIEISLISELPTRSDGGPGQKYAVQVVGRQCETSAQEISGEVHVGGDFRQACDNQQCGGMGQ